MDLVVFSQTLHSVCWWWFSEYLHLMKFYDDDTTWIPPAGDQACSVHLISSTSLGGSILSVEESLSWFVKFQCSNFAVGWWNWNRHLGTVLLVSDDLLDMEAPSSSVDGKDLANLTSDSLLNAAAFDVDGVSLPDWNWSAIVFSSEFLAQEAAHHLPSDAAGSGEVSLSRLSSLAGNTWIKKTKN